MSTVDTARFWDAGQGPAHWWEQRLAGRLSEHVIESRVLEGNPLGDPTERPLWVYTPPGYNSSEERYPSVYIIQGYTGQAVMWWNRTPFREGFPAAVDRMFASGEASPCIVVYVDAWTAYGGSQFVELTWHWSLPHVSLRRGRPICRRALPDHAGRGASRHQREIERRIRRDDHADAATRSLRRLCDARGRQPLRMLLRA